MAPFLAEGKFCFMVCMARRSSFGVTERKILRLESGIIIVEQTVELEKHHLATAEPLLIVWLFLLGDLLMASNDSHLFFN
jgi:hypothetical protein